MQFSNTAQVNLIMQNIRIKATVMLDGQHTRNAYATIKMGKSSQCYRLSFPISLLEKKYLFERTSIRHLFK